MQPTPLRTRSCRRVTAEGWVETFRELTARVYTARGGRSGPRPDYPTFADGHAPTSWGRHRLSNAERRWVEVPR